ncbi:MAG: hypothetical protein JF616_10950 [Fibrobacteres bacterium]|jgi:hypothetical protein|nr:hypothetical protein [Fibrobacterota bacterium]
MSSTDTRTVDPAQPHSPAGVGHELSDFSWTTVLWLIPISVIIMLAFFAVCIFWFKGAKDHEIAHKQAQFVPSELQALHAHEDEILTSYKILDKDKGRIRIPIARAMELVAQEHQGKPGREWVPITDTYLEGAAFAAAAAASAPAAEDNGIQVENAPEVKKSAKVVSGPNGAAVGKPASAKATSGKAKAAPQVKK